MDRLGLITHRTQKPTPATIVPPTEPPMRPPYPPQSAIDALPDPALLMRQLEIVTAEKQALLEQYNHVLREKFILEEIVSQLKCDEHARELRRTPAGIVSALEAGTSPLDVEWDAIRSRDHRAELLARAEETLNPEVILACVLHVYEGTSRPLCFDLISAQRECLGCFKAYLKRKDDRVTLLDLLDHMGDHRAACDTMLLDVLERDDALAARFAAPCVGQYQFAAPQTERLAACLAYINEHKIDGIRPVYNCVARRLERQHSMDRAVEQLLQKPLL